MQTPRMPRGVLTVAMAALILGFIVGAVGLLHRDDQRSPSPTPEHSAPAKARTATASVQPDTATDVALQQGLSSIASTPLYQARSTTPRITGTTSEHADLYATEFVRRLLSRDYAKTSRDSRLSWVQAESAPTTEPTVIGLVPESVRDRFAVWSVSDATAGPAPVPSQQEWTRLAVERATDVAQVDRVSQPVVWTNAVASGRITDPGVTAREVTATVTRTSPTGTERFSVAIGLNLEGPPVRTAYGIVGVITFTSIPVGPA